MGWFFISPLAIIVTDNYIGRYEYYVPDTHVKIHFDKIQAATSIFSKR